MGVRSTSSIQLFSANPVLPEPSHHGNESLNRILKGPSSFPHGFPPVIMVMQVTHPQDPVSDASEFDPAKAQEPFGMLDK